MKNLVEELKWRGLYHDSMPGTEEQLLKEATTAYIGFDPTADSLHIGSMVQIILLIHLKNFGHQPIALVGGATGMIGDPSGKSDERNLLNEETLAKNVAGIKTVLSRFLDFNSKENNAPIMVNNYDWMKEFSFIDFAREVGKRITVNYMMAKDSVKKRLSGEVGEGMSFTEFTYQLIQGYDFYHLHKNYNCVLQMGGSDQWGNITTGTELVRRMNPNTEAKAFALTTPLITKADGSKFGKSEGGNIWLDADKTSVYKFYQFWLNTGDEDAEKYIRIFTFLDKETIDGLIEEHKQAMHLRVLQRKLAEEITILVHGSAELEKAIKASNILFGNSTSDDLKSLDATTFLEIFDGVPQAEVAKTDIEAGINIVDALNEKSGFLKSNGEARRALTENSISVNKEKVTEDFIVNSDSLINDQFILLQRGKKNYFVINLKSKPVKPISFPKTPKISISKRQTITNEALNRFKIREARKNIFLEKNVLFLPKMVNADLSSEIRHYKVVSKIDGIDKSIASCTVSIGKSRDSISLTKELRNQLSLRRTDEVGYKIDKNKKEIILQVKMKSTLIKK